MNRKPLNGRESSILALIAQCGGNLEPDMRDRILASLKGPALRIAKVMLGITKNPSKATAETAKGFFDWANQLPEHKL